MTMDYNLKNGGSLYMGGGDNHGMKVCFSSATGTAEFCIDEDELLILSQHFLAASKYLKDPMKRPRKRPKKVNPL